MNGRTLVSALIVLTVGVGVSAADTRATAKSRLERERSSASICPEIPSGSYEVLLGEVRCSTDSLHLSFRATGRSLEGLSPVVSLGGNVIPLVSTDFRECSRILDALERVVENRNCSTAAPGWGTGFSFICDGERNEVVRTVGLALRELFDNSERP